MAAWRLDTYSYPYCMHSNCILLPFAKMTLTNDLNIKFTGLLVEVIQKHVKIFSSVS